MHTDPDRLPATLNVEQAGVLLGISRRPAYRGVEAGHIPAIRIGRRILVPTARLLRMLGLADDGPPREAGTFEGDGEVGQSGDGGPAAPSDPPQEPGR